MKTRWIFLAVAVVLVLAVGVGLAFAGSSTGSPSGTAAHDYMHNTVAMQQMHAQMPAATQKQCNELHAEMGTMMSGQMGTGMMGSSAMMDGSMTGR